MLLPYRVLGDGRVQPQPPSVALAVVEHALEDALGLTGSAFAAVDVVPGPEGLDGRGAGAKGVGDPVVRLARIYPLPDLLHVGLQRYALLGICHGAACSFLPLDPFSKMLRVMLLIDELLMMPLAFYHLARLAGSGS